jgi:hypothetical protein
VWLARTDVYVTEVRAFKEWRRYFYAKELGDSV